MSDLRYELWQHKWASKEKFVEPEIDWTGWSTRSPLSGQSRDSLGGHDWVNVKMHMETAMEGTQGFTGRLWSCECRIRLGGHDIQKLEAMIDHVSRYTSRPRSSILRDTLKFITEQGWRLTWRPQLCELADRNQISLDLHREALIGRTWRRPSCESGDALWGGNQATLEIHWDAIIMWNWRPWKSVLGDSVTDWHSVNSEIY